MAKSEYLPRQLLEKLCLEITDRCVGSAGNRQATDYFASEISRFGFQIELQEFDCFDWIDDGSDLHLKDGRFRVLTSPYTSGGIFDGRLVQAKNIPDLVKLEPGNILLLQDELCNEQLMPKNFPFYNPEHHQKIIKLLENSNSLAIIAATGKNPGLAGAVYPFPLIEDGDFTIPSVYMKDYEGKSLERHLGKKVELEIRVSRIPAKGYNIVARKGKSGNGKIVICAHIDSKKGTPGAIDNATGIIVLLLLAEKLVQEESNLEIEIVALNGEDYYSCPGQILYLEKARSYLKDIRIAINLDGAGYKMEETAYSFYGHDKGMMTKARKVFSAKTGFREGPMWYQSDHSIFLQKGVPAIALTSNNFMEKLSVEITHTSLDRPDIVDTDKLEVLSEALKELILSLNDF